MTYLRPYTPNARDTDAGRSDDRPGAHLAYDAVVAEYIRELVEPSRESPADGRSSAPHVLDTRADAQPHSRHERAECRRSRRALRRRGDPRPALAA